jgi:Mn-dependent DtxR family transcriptional regulator
MQQNQATYKPSSSKQLGELLFMPPRSVSGAMKKLLNEGYCRKQATNPVTYELTTLGSETQLDD